MDKKELCIKVAKEILPKLSEVADICKENDIERASWIEISSSGYINFRIGVYEFTRVDWDSDLTITYKEKV